MSTTKDPAATDRERALQALMIADLGSDRRNKCTTVDAKRARFEADAIESQRRIHVEGSEAHRRFENDEDLLNKWNHLHESINDTAQMEQLPDIAAGQSHRASLNAVMRALKSQAPRNQFHGPVARGGGRGGGHTGGHAGRGGGIAGSRGHGALPSRDRTSSLGAISKPGHPGSANHSASVSLGLDPALNINNNPAENDSRRPRGPRRRKSTSMLSSQQLQRSSEQQQRPDVNFSNMMADPANFMTSYRKTFETPLASSQGQGHATTASPNIKPGKNTLQPEAAAAPPVIVKLPAQTVLPEKTLPVGKPKVKTGKGAPKSEAIAASVVISNPLAQAVTPKKTLPAGKPEAHNGKGAVKSEVVAVKPVLSKSSVQLGLAEKTLKSLQPIKRNAPAATSDSIVVGMMGSHQVETPTPSPKASGASKVVQPKKSKAKDSAGRIVQPADVGPPSKEIQWHISPGEFPRTSQPIVPVAQTKKSKAAAGSKPPVAPSKHTKAPSDMLAAPAGTSVSKSVSSSVSTAAAGGNPPVSRNLTPKKQIQIESLLDAANSPISARVLETTPASSAARGKDVRVSEAVVAADEREDGKPPVPDIPKQKAKNAEEVKKTQDLSLLDTENQPISEAALKIPVLTPDPPAKSPATAELLGLKFSAEDSQKTIDKTLVRASQVSIAQTAEFERLLAKRVNEEVEIRLKHAREVLKRPSNKIARFEDWLNQADQEEATVIQDVLRKASFTEYRSRKEVLTDSSGDSSPAPKSKVPGQLQIVSNDFVNRFSNVGATSGSTSCGTPTQAPPARIEADLPIRLAPVPLKAAPVSAKPAKPAQVGSSAVTAKAAPVSVEGTSAKPPAPKKKQQSLLDSIYATGPEQTIPGPRLLSGNIPKPEDPRATGVRVIGPAPYDPKKKHEITSAVSAQQSAENTKFSGVQLVGPAPYNSKAYGQSSALNTQQASGNSKSADSEDSESVNRVKVIGVQPYNPFNRRN